MPPWRLPGAKAENGELIDMDWLRRASSALIFKRKDVRRLKECLGDQSSDRDWQTGKDQDP
jgi:hypothetical protein